MTRIRKKQKIKHADVVYAFGENLRSLRLSRGMSQAELASRAQIHTTYVGRLEKGLAAPGLDLLERLAAGLGTSLPELMPGQKVDSVPFLRDQARRKLDAFFTVADSASLGVLNAMLQMMYESASRGR